MSMSLSSGSENLKPCSSAFEYVTVPSIANSKIVFKYLAWLRLARKVGPTQRDSVAPLTSRGPYGISSLPLFPLTIQLLPLTWSMLAVRRNAYEG
ncbi:hypothetical protein GE061_019327 [Apolygus lucorum]|uniref:Uncharacterized protein n=1 Tax=Apolygus lucorum TaxID=248454 RepID=A0A8S9X7T7_APOLU|nr:hypothetical protein GE061_019327 [Apolygus lucorum]